MDSKEASAHFELAHTQLKNADTVFKLESYALCAFLSASSAENSTSALLINLGAKPSKKHRNSLVLYRLAQNITDLDEDLMYMVEFMKELEPHITRARYPILRGSELLPLDKVYTREEVEKLLVDAQKVFNMVEKLLKM